MGIEPMNQQKLLEFMEDKEGVQQILQRNGMDPRLLRSKAWETWISEEKLYNVLHQFWTTYRKEWDGPDVPIYILPTRPPSLFQRNDQPGAGFATRKEIFLFVKQQWNKDTLQALFVHEYHHTTRMQKRGDPIHFTLRDSLLMEGLAEYAVKEYCGESFVSPWSTQYDTKQLEKWWAQWIKPNLDLPRKDSLHQSLLQGGGGYPKFLGYAIGYEWVSRYAKKEKCPSKQIIYLPSNQFPDKLFED
ncbi:DUF2268 domain-containing protein [Bacillus fonticola]|uniref:DUF2268 domain-containing protein n=1 Tax=Bacillus fonticola TaxID=2728853 RepID=UPI001473F876|nr:DUF2268 domain-containing putative Zn-dependent protease [Bacillus fonticola]